MSSNSSMREVHSSSSDCETFVTEGTEEDDDKTVFHGSMHGINSDSNDTDYSAGTMSVDESLVLDRRSRQKRSMQRLLEKNKTLKSSLQQAKADLAQERHKRAQIDDVYLKIKKQMSSRLEAEEIKVANLRAELEQMVLEMKELKGKAEEAAAASSSSNSSSSGSGSSYKIGYDNSNFSLSSGLGGGLMLHHSNLLHHGQDEEDEFFCPVVSNSSNSNSSNSNSSSSSNSSSKSRTDMGSSASPRSTSPSQRHDEEIVEQDNEKEEETEKGNDHAIVEKDEDAEKKVTFLTLPRDIPAHIPSPLPAVVEPQDAEEEEEEEEEEDSDNDSDDDDHEDAPCTMMEMLIKKEQSRSAEDDIQDPPADANETFDSMAHKFLYQALHAKFTPARMILQLDDLLLKYDAPPEDLLLVLAQESMKWWEDERVKVGGPLSGGWGTGSVLIPETGDRVSIKDAVERGFKAIYIPLLLHYVASHQEQMLLLEKLEVTAKTSDQLMRNYVTQLVALYRFDVLDADAILEWWRLLKEPEGVFGHSGGLRSMISLMLPVL
ncbi:hypothetical protein EDD21DRAFT_175702 [Dissophora ornata]|nr:hypothetical protein EDD21DRAFT_175702 [Dissophora ornata]